MFHFLLSFLKCDHFLTTAHNNNRNYSHFNGLLDAVVSTELNHMNHMTLVFCQHAAITGQKPSLERTKKLSTIHPTSFHSPTSHRATRKQVPNFFLYSGRKSWGETLVQNPGQRPISANGPRRPKLSQHQPRLPPDSHHYPPYLHCHAQATRAQMPTTGNAIALAAMSVRKLCELQAGGKLRAFARYNKIGNPW